MLHELELRGEAGKSYASDDAERQVTVRHIRGLLQGLEAGGALDYAEVKIMVLDDANGVTLPNRTVVTQDTLPPEGILFVADES